MNAAFIRLAVLAEGTLVLLAIAIGWWLGTPPFARFRIDVAGVAWGIGATLPLLLALGWCLRTNWGPIARLIALVTERLGPLFAGATTPWLVLVAVSAGVGEEALFRGVLQTALNDPLPPWAAVAVVSALFGVAHWVNVTYAILAGVVGAYLGVLYLVTDNLLAAIITHALYDLVALSVLTRLKPAVFGCVV